MAPNTCTLKGWPLRLCLVTHSPDRATDAERAGVERVLVDIERIGKQQRQAGEGLFLSAAVPDDVSKVRKVLRRAELAVRVDQWHEGSRAQIDDVISRGADVVMLPMVERLDDIDAFVHEVGGKAGTWLLLETAGGLRLAESLAGRGIDEVHIGLNDLRLSLGLLTLFDAVAEGTLDPVARAVQATGAMFGFGGVTSPGRTGLPVEPAIVIGEQVRLSSSMAWLGRSFPAEHEHSGDPDAFRADIESIAACVEAWRRARDEDLVANHGALAKALRRWHRTLNAETSRATAPE